MLRQQNATLPQIQVNGPAELWKIGYIFNGWDKAHFTHITYSLEEQATFRVGWWGVLYKMCGHDKNSRNVGNIKPQD